MTAHQRSTCVQRISIDLNSGAAPGSLTMPLPLCKVGALRCAYNAMSRRYCMSACVTAENLSRENTPIIYCTGEENVWTLESNLK